MTRCPFVLDPDDPSRLTVWVPGRPAPQGSKHARPVYRGRGDAREFTGKVATVESSKAKVDAWRNDVRAAAAASWAGRPPIATGVRLQVQFVMPRPTSTPKRSTPAAIKRPDQSKLLRSTEDALTSAGVWLDDSLVIDCHITKRIAEPDEPSGAWLDVTPCGPVPAPPTTKETTP